MPSRKSAPMVAADYLKKLYAHCMQILEKQFSEPLLEITTIEFYFTIPAVWPDQTRKMIERLAIRAGFESKPGSTVEVCKFSCIQVNLAMRGSFADGTLRLSSLLPNPKLEF